MVHWCVPVFIRSIDANALVAAKVVDRQIARDREEPRFEPVPRLVAGDLLDYTHPGLLEKILGQGWLPDHSQQKPIQLKLILRQDFSQRIRITVSQPDKGVIGGPGRYRVQSGREDHSTESNTNDQCEKTPGIRFMLRTVTALR